ncbi:hypothetical protein IFM47457_07227 [Aspergillus lentulus]|nr:hypothetical protein IFM47457_07227 [Aspergillus lentulus]
MQMKTIFPGFYVERAIHIHVQLYFEEELEEKIMGTEPSASHTQINRTTNVEDMEFSNGMVNGFNPIVSVVQVGDNDLSKGLIGYITLGVDSTAVEDEHWSLYLVDREVVLRRGYSMKALPRHLGM